MFEITVDRRDLARTLKDVRKAANPDAGWSEGVFVLFTQEALILWASDRFRLRIGALEYEEEAPNYTRRMFSLSALSTRMLSKALKVLPDDEVILHISKGTDGDSETTLVITSDGYSQRLPLLDPDEYLEQIFFRAVRSILHTLNNPGANWMNGRFIENKDVWILAGAGDAPDGLGFGARYSEDVKGFYIARNQKTNTVTLISPILFSNSTIGWDVIDHITTIKDGGKG